MTDLSPGRLIITVSVSGLPGLAVNPVELLEGTYILVIRMILPISGGVIDLKRMKLKSEVKEKKATIKRKKESKSLGKKNYLLRKIYTTY